MNRKVLLLIFATLVAGALAGCGSDSSNKTQTANLILDFTPNAVHAGIYTALKDDLYKNSGVNLKVQEPSMSSDSLKLVEAGKADFAIADIHDIGIAREHGAKIVGVDALVEQPLAAVITLRDSNIGNPGQLVGKKVGVTGLPSDVAVLDSEVKNTGGDPAKVDQVTIGFNAVASLISKKVTGATAFWNAEGVTLASKGYPIKEFKVDEYGAPSYPELVVVTSEKLAKENPDLIKKVVQATNEGYKQVVADPKAGLSALTSEVKGLDPKLMKQQLDALMPAIKGKAPSVGYLDPKVLNQWGKWDVQFGILKKMPDVTAAFTNKFQ